MGSGLGLGIPWHPEEHYSYVIDRIIISPAHSVRVLRARVYARDFPPIRNPHRPRASRSSSDPPLLTRPQRHALAESVIVLSVPFRIPARSSLDPVVVAYRHSTDSIHIPAPPRQPSALLLQSRHTHSPRFVIRNGHPSGTARAGRISGKPDTAAEPGDLCVDGANDSIVGRPDSVGGWAKCLSPVDHPPGRPGSRTQIHAAGQTRYAIQCA